MDVIALDIPEVRLLRPRRFDDARGYFSETYSRPTLERAGVTQAFVQDNLSYSARAGTVRGLHYQTPPHAQAKLVAVLTGAIMDVAVDVRAGSPTYGRHVTADLDAEGGWQMLIPAGFLHGFVTRAPDTRVLYKVSDVYAADCDRSVRWDDPDLAIGWGISRGEAVLSAKDAEAVAFAEFRSPFAYGPAPEPATS